MGIRKFYLLRLMNLYNKTGRRAGFYCPAKTTMIFLLYAVLAFCVVFFSIKCANYVDLLDKKTQLSGAFIGGVILAAVTSLPELFTSITAVTVVHNPELIMGNVLGSNIFNLAALATLMLFTARYFAKAKIANSHLITLICTLIINAIMVVTVLFQKSGEFLTINSTSFIILAVYIISFRFMAEDDSAENEEEDTSSLTVKQVTVRFVLMALGLIISSILITYVTDQIADTLNLNSSLAGALFLGVATSLPELSSCIALVKVRNYNACMGNIVGSNMFNFTILTIGDILVTKGSVYVPDSGVVSAQTRYMLIYGIAASVLMGLILALKRKGASSKTATAIYAALSLGIVVCYLVFLILSV